MRPFTRTEWGIVSLFPVFLKLDGKRCLVVGGGPVAWEKVESLRRCGARVTVVSPDVVPEIRELSAEGGLEWRARPFSVADLADLQLVIAATNDHEANRIVADEAARRSILCNAVDDPTLCDFFCASIVERGGLQIAISTAGKSPALAQRLKAELEHNLAPDMGRWLDDLGDLRREVLQALPASESRKQILHWLAAREVCPATDCPARREALSSALGQAPGQVHDCAPSRPRGSGL